MKNSVNNFQNDNIKLPKFTSYNVVGHMQIKIKIFYNFEGG